jgi:hypothetical protein
MTLSIADIKKNRNLNFGEITKALSKGTDSYKNDDDDYFKVTRDKAGNGSAVIRFLPAAPGDELPWVQIYSHAFKGPSGKWYINNCLSTIGQDDPVNDFNRELWNSPEGSEQRKQASAQKRKLQYHGWVYVVSDPGNRENEGKVMKFKYGKKIFEMIMSKIQPTFADDVPVNVFDLWEGANFKLRMKQVEGYPNYDSSSFGDVGPVADSDDKILAIVNSQKPLSVMLDPKNFKSYDDLKKQLHVTLGLTGGVRPTVDEPVREAKPVKAVEPKPTKVVEPEEDGEDLEDYFKSIGN